MVKIPRRYRSSWKIIRPNRHHERLRTAKRVPFPNVLPFAKGELMTDLITQMKGRAKRLRTYLSDLGHTLSHAQSLEAISKEEGCRDWNTLSAQLRQQEIVHDNRPPIQVGDRARGTYRGSDFEGTVLALERTDGSAKQLGPVWRIKIQFDGPVRVGTSEHMNLTRQRVRAMIDREGRSVNLKGVPDGFMQLDLP